MSKFVESMGRELTEKRLSESSVVDEMEHHVNNIRYGVDNLGEEIEKETARIRDLLDGPQGEDLARRHLATLRSSAEGFLRQMQRLSDYLERIK